MILTEVPYERMLTSLKCHRHGILSSTYLFNALEYGSHLDWLSFCLWFTLLSGDSCICEASGPGFPHCNGTR